MCRPHPTPVTGVQDSVARHPDDVELNSRLETATLSMREGLRPTNTAKAIDPKIEEYFQFCDCVYPSDPYKYNLCYEKVYRFMWYTCFREKKKRAYTKDARQQGILFDYDGYKLLMNNFTGGNSAIDYPEPKNPISK